MCARCLNDREYAEQLKSSRDELATASNTDVDSSAAAYAEKRTLLTQKASMQRMATETRRWGYSYYSVHVAFPYEQSRPIFRFDMNETNYPGKLLQ